MLQRCRPKALKTVTVVENELITPETLMRISTASTPISHSDSGSNFSSNPASSINNNSVSNPLSSPITSSLPNSDYLIEEPETELQETTGLPAVKVLRYCENSFELFEKGDGSSKIVFYKPKEKKLDFGEENNNGTGGNNNDNKDNKDEDNKTDSNIKLNSHNAIHTKEHHDIENPQGEESKEEVGSPIHFTVIHSAAVNNTHHNNINNSSSSGSNHNSLNSEGSLPIAEAVIVERKDKDPPTDV
jgi:hypothetical protein